MVAKIKFSKEDIEDILNKYKEGYSKLEISHQYKLDNSVIKRILIENKIKQRSIQEQNKTEITKNKAKSSSINIFGVDNPSKSIIIKQRREITLLKKYGVKNSFQIPSVRKKAILGQNTVEYKTNLSKRLKLNNPLNNPLNREKLSKSQKERISKYNLEQLRALTASARKMIRSPSKPEQKIKDLLTNNNIEFKSHFFLKGFSYDFKINNNLLLEVQGDFWHLNPKYYSEKDFLFDKSAIEVWDKDKMKKRLAEEEGYNLICIWESELKSLNDVEILNLIKN